MKTFKDLVFNKCLDFLRESENERIWKQIIEIVRTSPIPDNHAELLAYLEKQKEQKYYWKPTETDVALFNKAVTTNNTLTPAERANLDIIRSKFGCCRATNCSGIVQKEQKLVEWNEKDSIHLENAILSAEKEWGNESYTAMWLKSLPERFNLQPKEEWSEEDEEIFNNIIEKAKDGHWIEVNEITWLITRFKSLRPQYHGDVTMTEAYKMGFEAGKASSWKPSEQEKGALRTAIYVLTEERNFPKAAGHLQAILNAFDGKQSRKEWKPSEEQMDALKHLLEYVAPSEKYIVIIKNLYDDLRKLM